MAKIIIAPDSFKGTLNAVDFVKVASKTLQKLNKSNIIYGIPMADGGEGTLCAINTFLNASKVNLLVHNQYGDLVKAYYLVTSDNKVIIESAMAIGLNLSSIKNTMIASTVGVGEMIADAIAKGYKDISIALGGSSTTDAGAGMLSSLGVKFYGSNHIEFVPTGATLNSVEEIDTSILEKYQDIRFTILSDVDNPLFGENGAAYVYASQKGANTKEIKILDANLAHFADVSSKTLNIDKANALGAGAAGGLGYAFIEYLNALVVSGANFILELAKFNDLAKNCDYIITGEGHLDKQSLMGKVLKRLIDNAPNKKIISICGSSHLEESIPNLEIYNLTDETCLTKALKNPKKYLKQIIKKIGK